MRVHRGGLALALGSILAVVAVRAAIGAASGQRQTRHAPPSRAVAPVEEQASKAFAGDTPTPTPPPSPSIARFAPAPPPDRATALRDALTWPDREARIEAVRSAIADGAAETLPVLEATDLAGDPETAPTVIHAVAALGHQAGRREHADAARTLGAWLGAEQLREGADARGNVSVLVDALGDLGGRDAAVALASALDSSDLPLHVQTLAVERLVAMGYGETQPAFAGYAARVAALPPTDGFDELLRQEALAVVANGFDL
jgi:hypothetical protein